MADRAPGDHLPPEQDHYRYVTASGVLGYSGKSALIVVRSHDSGDADRAAVLYVRSVLGGVAPFRIKHHSEHEEAIRLRPIKNPHRQIVTRRRQKGLQAKHIPDIDMLLSVAHLSGRDKRWTFTSQYVELFPEMPPKVVAAKLDRLQRRGLLEGCGCGCRGDWYLTDEGGVVVRSFVESPAMLKWIDNERS